MHLSSLSTTLLSALLQIVLSEVNNDNLRCGSDLRGFYGKFHTPNYPKMYPNKLSCIWNITVPNGYRLQLNFTEFELEWTDYCSYDYVKVKGNNGTIGKYCGKRTEKPLPYVTAPPKEPIYSLDNSLEVFLHTDFSNEIEVFGFEAHFAALDINECLLNNGGCSQLCHNFIGGYYCSCRMGYTLHDNERDCIVSCQNIIRNQMEGVITSPEYPQPYPPFASCEYHITAEKGYFVHLKFMDFKIEDHHESLCPYDYLLIEDEKEKKGPYCGKTKPEDFISFSNWLIVEFKSDKSLALTGFKAEYKLEAIKCPTLNAIPNGFMRGPSNFSYKETVSFSCYEGYVYTGSLKRTCMSDGTWSGYLGNCTRITCKDPEIVPDEGYITDPLGITPYYYGHKLNVHCDSFHDLFGSKTITCVGNNSWAGVGAYCVKTCGKTVQRNLELESCKGGIHRVPSLQYSQPWLVAIKDGDKLKCAGILISKEWILTASHCVAYAPERNGDRGNLVVVIGASEWNAAGHVSQTRTVKEIRVSQKFDYGIHSDVALVRLSSEVVMSGDIQPICLPSERTHRHLFRAKKKVVSIGWQHDKTDKKTDRCLEIEQKTICKNHYDKLHKDLHTNRYKTSDGREKLMPADLICVKELPQGSSDLCKIIPGSGLVAYHEESKKWYLGGILTWSSDKLLECKETMTTFSIYSQVHRYVNWIQSRTKLNLKYPDTEFVPPETKS